MLYLDTQSNVANSPLKQELEGATILGVSDPSTTSPEGAAANPRRKAKKKAR